MDSHEARSGAAVRVRDGVSNSRSGGMLGTVERVWGNRDYPALDVRLEDGRSELFWYHELDEAREDPTA